ncbi:ATP synthase beta chain, putative [Eimeria maxima]|uniref:ATP synthase beta chain, putative n=1 Tax=Eimeria maxima TaxID=5804 RepID=U6M205_EIMMA|nr:ATP synthase beta chain, putative [Eimeria maxima]CDJ58267.1 ATP synthase beta chain, putative [Eimeria maxima]
MAREIRDIREFLQTARRKDARKVIILKKVRRGGNPYGAAGGAAGGAAAAAAAQIITKFKIRCAKQLYTLVVTDKQKAQKIESSLPPSVKQQVIPAKK